VRTKKLGTEKLKSAIDVPYVYAKDETYYLFPAPGIEFAHPGILAIYTMP
jgi:hypothetical protein